MARMLILRTGKRRLYRSRRPRYVVKHRVIVVRAKRRPKRRKKFLGLF